jgi:peptide/nickel transport system permease protein
MSVSAGAPGPVEVRRGGVSALLTLQVRGRRGSTVPGSLRLGLMLLVVAVLFAVYGQLFLGDPNHQDLAHAYAKPGTAGHLLGTDPLGRDVLTWTASSVKTAFVISVSVVLITAVVGVIVGLVAGYAGGVIDSVLMRIVDLQLAVPPLLLFIAAAAVVGTSITTLVLLLAAVGWVPYARLVRTQVLVERTRASVVAARLAGVSHTRILARHLLPSAVGLIVVFGSLQLGLVLLIEASLSFVGYGVKPPWTSLGFLIAQGRGTLQEAWWVVVVPGAMLAMLVLTFNLIGDGLRDRWGVDLEAIDR